MNELLLQDILDQSNAVSSILPVLRKDLKKIIPMIPNNIRRIVFTGSGDSFIAPFALFYAIRRHIDKELHVLSSQECLYFWNFQSTDLIIPISISGETPRTVAAAERAKDNGSYVLSITANPASSLAAASAAVLTIPYKSCSRAIPHSSDYLTTLIALAVFTEAISGHRLDILDSFNNHLPVILNDLLKKIDSIGARFSQSQRYVFIGTGPDFWTGCYGTAKFWEARGMDSATFEMEEFGHGAHMTISPKDAIIILANETQINSRIISALPGIDLLTEDLLIVTNELERFSNRPVLETHSLPDHWSPLSTCLPMQFLCWSISNHKNYDVLSGGRHVSFETYNMVLAHLRAK